MKDARRICFFPDTGIERATFNTDPYTFEDCGYGVVAKRVRSDIRLCRMNTLQGIHVHNVSASNHATIAHNRIEARHTGIGLYYNDAAQFVRVHDNHIQLSAPAALLGNRTGIDVQYTKFADCRLRLYCNHVSMLTSGWGIRLNSARAAAGQGNIHHNIISFDPNPNGLTAGNPAGLLLLNTDNFRLSENDISGSGGAQVAQNPLPPANGTNQHGISLWAASDNRVECNRLDQTAVGVGFTMLCAGTQLRGNDIGSHSLGLAYSSTAATGNQIDAGNSWNGSYAYLGAENLGNFNNSLYGIDFAIPSNTAPFYPPTVSPVVGWFGPGPATNNTYACPIPVNSCLPDNNGSFYLNNDNPTFFHNVARDSTITYQHNEEMLWEAQRHLLRMVGQYDSLLVDTVLQHFYQRKITEAMGALNGIENQLDSLGQVWRADSVYLQNLDTIRLGYLELLSTDSTIRDSVIVLLHINDSLRNVHILAQSVLQEQQIDLLQNANTALLLSELYEYNEQEVNRLIFAFLREDSLNFTPAQIATLYDIASQCPLSGGSAVFKARSLYKLFSPNTEFNDYYACMQGGLQLRDNPSVPNSDFSVEETFYLYPNPVADILYVDFQSPPQVGGELTLSNMQGLVLIRKVVEAGSKNMELGVSGLPEGVYALSWQGRSRKVVIVR